VVIADKWYFLKMFFYALFSYDGGCVYWTPPFLFYLVYHILTHDNNTFCYYCIYDF
jgi:hypothetical protein